MTRSALMTLTIATAAILASALSGFAQQTGMPIVSTIPSVGAETDRGVQSFASSTSGASSIPVSMTPNPFNGVLNASLSIALPRAKGRAMPPFSITYDSLRSDGLLGVGWSLSAGVISRSRRFGIDYSGNKFVLVLGANVVDLIDVGTGVYHDKLDTLRVEAIRIPAGEDLSSWLVTDVFGTKYYFGSNADSRRQSLNGTAEEISEWHLDRVEDLTGNYSTLEYQIDNGCVYLKAIRFTGNNRASLLPHNSVEISYESRPVDELIASFGTNHESLAALRVRSIKVSANGLPFASYTFAYKQSSETKRSLLSSISRSVSQSTSAAPPILSTPSGPTPTSEIVTLAYSDQNTSTVWLTDDNSSGPARDALMNYQCIPGDFNGDGKTDLACSTNTSGGWSVGISRTATNHSLLTSGNHMFNGFNTTLWNGPTVPKTLSLTVPFSCPLFDFHCKDTVVTVPDVRRSCFTGEFNGDNRDDIACYDDSNSRWQVGLSTPSNFQVSTWTHGPTGVTGTVSDRCLVGDFNGDGLSDVACLISGEKDSGRWSVAITQSGNWQPSEWHNGAAPQSGHTVFNSCRVGDFDGDRRSDIACYDPASKVWFVGLSTGSGFGTKSWTVASDTPLVTASDSLSSRCIEGDFNGDGKTDFACHKGGSNGMAKEGAWWVMLSTGSSWKTALWAGAPVFSDDADVSTQCFSGDMNGDGRTDIACRAVGHLEAQYRFRWWMKSLAGHDTFVSSEVVLGNFGILGTGSILSSCAAGDFDGDGKTDLICDEGWGYDNHGQVDNATKNKYELTSPDTHKTDLLNTIHTTSGLVASFEYASSSDQPMTRIGFPIPVVAHVAQRWPYNKRNELRVREWSFSKARARV